MLIRSVQRSVRSSNDGLGNEVYRFFFRWLVRRLGGGGEELRERENFRLIIINFFFAEGGVTFEEQQYRGACCWFCIKRRRWRPVPMPRLEHPAVTAVLFVFVAEPKNAASKKRFFFFGNFFALPLPTQPT